MECCHQNYKRLFYVIMAEENKWKKIPENLEVVAYNKEVATDYGYSKKETRYYVIDKETGEMIDDAQGWGYKSKEKAYKCIAYKLNKKKIDSDKQKVFDFIKEHKEYFKNLVDIIGDDCLHGTPWSNTEMINYIKKQNFEDIPCNLKTVIKYMFDYRY